MRLQGVSSAITLVAFSTGYFLGLLSMIVIMYSPDETLPSNVTTIDTFPSPSTEVITTQPSSPVYQSPGPMVLPKVSQAMVVLIFSAPNSTERRCALRETWLPMATNLNITARFLVGTDGLNSGTLRNVTSENKKFNDMLLIPDVTDSFHNLTLKLLKGIIWAQTNVKFDYLMKADDDTYVRLDKAIEGVRNMKDQYNKKLHWGYFFGNGIPMEKGKYEEHNWFKCPNYLPYSLGACYILSESVVSMMVRFSDKLYTGYNNDDVSIGAWLAPYDIIRIHDLRFTFSTVKAACKQDFIASHIHSPETIHQFHENVAENPRKLCERKIESQFRYVYDWNLSPPKCCKARRNMQMKPFSVTHSGFARNNRYLKLTE